MAKRKQAAGSASDGWSTTPRGPAAEALAASASHASSAAAKRKASTLGARNADLPDKAVAALRKMRKTNKGARSAADVDADASTNASTAHAATPSVPAQVTAAPATPASAAPAIHIDSGRKQQMLLQQQRSPSAALATRSAAATPKSRPPPEHAFAVADMSPSSAPRSASSIMSVSSPTMDLSLLLLAAGQAACFKGSALMAAVIGSCRVFGFEAAGPLKWNAVESAATSKSQPQLVFVPVYSASSSSLIRIEARTDAGASPARLISKAGQSGVTDVHAAYAQEVLRLLQAVPAKKRASIATVVAIRGNNSRVEGIERMQHIFRNIFSSEADRAIQPNLARFALVAEDQADAVGPLVIPDTWETTVDTLIASLSNTDENASSQSASICAVGARNSGKSTFTRYLINRIVSKHGQVAYLDCDPGQPGCTAPGVVSLHRITAPLLGPAFTTILSPFRSLFLGATTPKNDPDYFLACVCELVHTWKTQLGDVPLVVNTNGWIKGMGLDLLNHFLAYLAPSDVVHLASITTARTMDFAALMRTLPSLRVHQPEAVTDVMYNKIKLNAADQRALSLASYFMASPDAVATSSASASTSAWPLWDFGTPLTHRLPYAVKWESLRIKFLLDDVPHGQCLYALNGTVVGLLVDSSAYQAHEAPSDGSPQLQIVPTQVPLHPNSSHCAGLGLIRAIDPDQGLFHVLTPLPLSQLRRVNLIVRSSGLDVPVSLFADGYELTRTHLPYTTFMSAEGVGAASKRNRHLQRRRQASNGR
ncbi:Pre-mRNA cleavage complex II protein Clp1-domain-containing protein [Entophlyctis helioformis]|nr:Pre-mRNA cleavage complex II protein Clp1-domain-containing protein [Entophlyctis helioformis]